MNDVETIHVLIADDHDLVRSGLKAAMRTSGEFSVVAEARDGAEAVREAKRVKPELVVECGFTEWTQDGKLRHPRFIGLRDDKSPREVVREAVLGSNRG